MTVSHLLQVTTSAEISEWMAFDRLKDDDYRTKIEQSNMTEEQRNDAILAILGGGNGNN